MAPPCYADLGKKANDLFSKGYHFGLLKLDLKTKSEAGVEFNSGLCSNQESGKVFGSLSSKYSLSDMGLTFTEKWNTDNILGTEVTLAEKLLEGVKITVEGIFAPQTGTKSGKLKTSYANEMVTADTSIDLDLEGPMVDGSCVLHYEGWLAGFTARFDTNDTKFVKNNFALGFQQDQFVVHTNVNNGSDFMGTVYQQVSDQIEIAVQMKWSVGADETLFGVAGKYHLDSDASLHAKVNNNSLIGLAYSQKLRDGIVMTLSACIDGANFNAGGHKVGLALELQP